LIRELFPAPFHYTESIGIIAATIHFFSLNRNDETTDNKTYGTSPQGSGYEYLHGSLCNSAEDAARKSRANRRGIGGEKRSISNNDIQLGVCHTQAADRRQPSKTGGSPRRERSNALAERVNPDCASTALVSVFQESGKITTAFAPIVQERRKFPRISALVFPESKGLLGKNFEKILTWGLFLLTISPSRDIMSFRDAHRSERNISRRSNQNSRSLSPSVTPCDGGRFFYVL